MITERLALQLEELGDDPLTDHVFDILANVLQPDSALSVDIAVTQLTALLPDRDPYSAEVDALIMRVIDLAEQIPYYHASMVKLVTIADLCLTSSRCQPLTSNEPRRRWLSAESLREEFNHRDPAKWVSLESFVARAHKCGLLEGCDFSIGSLRLAFGKETAETREGRNALVKSALQHILIHGEAIYLDIADDDPKQSEWRHWRKPKYDSRRDRWRHWYEQVSAVAAQNADEKQTAYSQDTIELADQAMEVMEAMEAIERLKMG
nr:hypothetical protein CFP56_21028 [Quercus suber]